MTELRITAVDNRRERRDFIAVQQRLYRDDRQAVTPLFFERRQTFAPHAPFFDHAQARFWVAYRGGEPVGRISAQIDQLHLERHGDGCGYFGVPEAADAEVMQALLTHAEGWLREAGLRGARGPFNLSINQECGLLVEGFDTPPMVFMGHARPFYGAAIEQAGYVPARDLLAYVVRPDFTAPAVMKRLLRQVGAALRVRPLEVARIDEEVALLRDIFNDAWADNFGFVPFTEREFGELRPLLRYLMDHRFVQVAELDGRPVAMIAALPNLNEVIADLDGRLLPLGWARLLWRLKVRHPRSARVALMGVRREFQHTRLGGTLAFAVIEAVRWALHARGVRDVEMSWILEDNKGMRGIIEAIGGRIYKRYRLYEKLWGPAP